MPTKESSSKNFDVIIVGGGVMGCSTAHHLLSADGTLQVAVVEKDPSYSRASSALSVGNARLQFSLQQNIKISMYTMEVLESFAEDMAVDGVPADVSFKTEGNLFLVSEETRGAARKAWSLQRRLGCPVEWLSALEIEGRVPLLNAESVLGGTMGTADGHLDGYAFLMAYRHKAIDRGAVFVKGRVEKLLSDSGAISGVELADGRRMAARSVVNCGGAWAAQILATTGIQLPVEPVQRQVFVVEPEVRPAAPMPLISHPSGLYFRSEGEDRVLVGRSMTDDRTGFDLRWEESRFTETLWPDLVDLVPAFERLRFERGWAGLYAVNRLDGNAILGEWPELPGLFLANGFSGHGLQQAPAVGRYLAEMILDRTPTLDLSVFGPERILTGQAIEESALV